MTRYPIFALGVLAAVDGLYGYALLVLGPDIGRTLGIGPGTVAGLGLLTLLCASLGALTFARLAQRLARRAVIAVAAGGGWSAASAASAFVTGPWALAAVAAADGASTGAVRALHPALLAELYPPAQRVRALAQHRAVDAAGLVLGPALVAGLSASGLTWRGVLLGVAAASALATIAAAWLRDPAGAPARSGAPVPTVLEEAHGVLLVPTARRILAAYAVAGVFLVPLFAYLFFFLEDRWALGATGRGLVLAGCGLATASALLLLGPEGDRLLVTRPAALVRIAWPLSPLAGAALAVAVLAPALWLTAMALAAAFALLALVQVAALALLMGLVAPASRPVAAALSGVAATGVGGLGGLLLLGSAEEVLGTGGAVASLAVPAALAGLVLRGAAATVDEDTAHAHQRERAARDVRPNGAAVEARGLVLAHGGHPVLDGLDLCLEEGELVALLGTNGAGKSTLLRVLAGVLAPTSGRVWLRGMDVTLLAPERRASLGLVHVPERAFDSLQVRETLFLAAHVARRPNPAAAVAAVLERVPVLAARARVRARDLSGGERHMLALGQSLLLRPRVLLVDEPARGLAPDATRMALELLRRENERGVTVLLVEQSPTMATAWAPRALFIERGSLLYDGSSEGLLRRDDLLRPVYLRGRGGT